MLSIELSVTLDEVRINANLVQPLVHGLFGLATNPIAKSYG
jgi:hypothetical protein